MRESALWSVVLLFVVPSVAVSATITVCPSGCDATTVADAIHMAAAGDTVLIHPGSYPISDDNIIDKTLTIMGSGPGVTTVESDGSSAVFRVVDDLPPDGTVRFTDLGITGGGVRGGIQISVTDPAYNEDAKRVEVVNCEIYGNVRTYPPDGGSGGISVETSNVTLVVESSQIHHNRGDYVWGGAIGVGAVGADADDVTITVDSCFIHDNWAGSGGGIGLGGNTEAWLTNSLIASNSSAHSGGGLRVSGESTVQIANTTIAFNHVVPTGGYGDGICNQGGIVDISFSTIALNHIYSDLPPATDIVTFGGVITLTATVVSNQPPYGHDCWADDGGVFVSGGYNVDEDGTCGLTGPGDVSGEPAGLGEFVDLGDHRGHFPLLPWSPAIDHVEGIRFPPVDQLGTPRPQDGDGDGVAICDSGSVESVLFFDGFESGDTAAWSATVP